jgi:hypothetical protein
MAPTEKLTDTDMYPESNGSNPIHLESILVISSYLHTEIQSGLLP